MAESAETSEVTVGERTAMRVDLGEAQAWVFSSDEVVWFVVTTVEDVDDIVLALP